MSDEKEYIKKRTEWDNEFVENYEDAYTNLKIGIILRLAREEAGLTQEDVAKKLNIKKTSISRIENHAEEVRLSTLRRYANAIGQIFKFDWHIPRNRIHGLLVYSTDEAGFFPTPQETIH